MDIDDSELDFYFDKYTKQINELIVSKEFDKIEPILTAKKKLVVRIRELLKQEELICN